MRRAWPLLPLFGVAVALGAAAAVGYARSGAHAAAVAWVFSTT